MSDKILQTRIKQKIDTKANWDKAVSFVPLKGEIVVYSDLNKIKVGDGAKKVSELPFLADSDTHQSIKALNTNNTSAQTVSSSEAIAGSGTINLHKVAKTGSYSDLNDRPTNLVTTDTDQTITGAKNFSAITATAIGTGSDANNYFQSQKFRGEGDANTYYHAVDFGYAGHNQVDFYEYGGNYNFYINTQANTDSRQLLFGINPSGIKIPPVAGAKVLGTNAEGQVESHSLGIADISSLQSTLDGKVNSSSLATVAKTGSYNDLNNKPNLDAKADNHRHYKSGDSGRDNGVYTYYKLASFPADNAGNSCSLTIDGRIGGWNKGNKGYLSMLISNRDGIAASGMLIGNAQLNDLCDLVVYTSGATSTNSTATLYVKTYSWFAFDLTLGAMSGAEDVYDGNGFRTTPAGTLAWSLSQNLSKFLQVRDDGDVLKQGHSVALRSEIPNVANKGATLEWGKSKTIATIGTTDITATLPSNPNTDTHYTNYLQIKGNGTEAVKFTQNADKTLNLKPGTNVSISAASGEITISATDTNTHNSHAIISGTKSDNSTQIKGSASSGDITLGDSGVTAGAYGDTTAQTPGYNATFKVPSISVNAKGIVTAIGEHTVKIPASDNTDTKNTAGSTNDSGKLYLVGAKSQAANPQTYSNSKVYMTDGTLTAPALSTSTMVLPESYLNLKFGSGDAMALTSSFEYDPSDGTRLSIDGHLLLSNGGDHPSKPTNQTGASFVNYADYFSTGITVHGTNASTSMPLVSKLSFPGKSGTFALTSDLPTKVSELTNDSGYVKGTVLSSGGGYSTVIANNGNAFSVTNSTVTSNGGGTTNAIFSIDSSGVHITKSGNKSDVVTANNLKKINNNSLIGSGNINIPTMSHYHVHKGPYSADNNKDHTVYSVSSTAQGNGNGCLIMVHGHIMYQSGYINITDTSTVYTDYDSYAIQAGEEGYWGKSWVTATAFFEPGKNMYVHAKGVESIYVICIYF